MSKLARRKNYPPPYDDKTTTRTRQTSLDVTKTETKIRYKKIFQRAISSAQKHGINLEPGRENKGNGNCSYEAAIYNINDRKCFADKLPMSHDYYRRIWNTDMMNKIIDKANSDWNPGLTNAQLREGFEEVMESGVYEIPFFGDMMIAGIACGMKKRILIFNTNEKTTHDPISVVDPLHYGGVIDTDIPVVVAYDIVHFESLHPVDSKDIDETIKLVKSYIAQPSRYGVEYGFTRSDIKDLISDCTTNASEEKVSSESVEKDEPEKGETKEIKNDVDFKFDEIWFRELINGKIRCGVCKIECVRLIVHLNSSAKCSMNFNMPKLKIEYSKFRSRKRLKNHENKRKIDNIVKFKADSNQRQKERQAKRKTENLEGFKKKAQESKSKHVTKKKAENLDE